MPGGIAIKFRTEIEGLRAAAVLPILLFHAGIDTLSGGFVGVDIFFVISGFLITTIIAREMEEERFTIAKFYKRRALRLFPALFVMLAATLLAAALLLFPSEVRAVTASAEATALFASNIYFWLTSGYFTTTAETMPLLHTWSLGVEEQFYLFYPLLVLIVRRWRPSALVPAILIVTLASLGLSIAMSLQVSQADFAFYMIPSRTWQLGLGALIALRGIPGTSKPMTREVAAALGLAMIALSFFIVPTKPGFPAPWALLPCLGTALILGCAEGTIAGRLLSIAPARFIGRISYSLYLWHWPIITFYRLQTHFDLTHKESLGLIVASVAIASASYFWVERPFLRHRGISERRVLTLAAAGMVVAVATSAGVSAASDRLRTIPEAPLHVSRFTEYFGGPEFKAQFREGSCFIQSNASTFDSAACATIVPGRRNVILAGDSHAAHLWRALAQRSPEVQLGQVTAAGCRPLLHATGDAYCTRVMQWLFDTLIPRGGIDAVVLSANWHEEEIGALVETIRYLRARGVDVIVIGPSMAYRKDLPVILSRALLRGDIASVSQYQNDEPKPLSDRIQPRVIAAGARYVPAIDIQCPRGTCTALMPNGDPALFDQDHVTPAGAVPIVEAVGHL